MRRIGELLKVFLDGRFSGEDERILAVVEAWQEAAGGMAEHARLRDIRSGTLVVEADHPGWGQLVGLRKAALLSALRRQFPELDLREIRVRIGGRTDAGSPAPKEPPARAGGAANATEPSGMASIEEVLSHVPEEELKRSLRALYEGADERNKREPR